jgi:serine/threonine protein kinase
VAGGTLRKESLHQGVEGFAERLQQRQEGSCSAQGIFLFTDCLLQSFFKEAVVWKRLKHPNIIPFLGVTMNPLQFVSEWMPNGTLTRYVTGNPSANRIALVSQPPRSPSPDTDAPLRYWTWLKVSITFMRATRSTGT